MEIRQDVLLQQFAVKFGDAVDGMTADARQVRHAQVALARLIDDGQATQAFFVIIEAMAHFVQKAGVDLEYDLHMARQYA